MGGKGDLKVKVWLIGVVLEDGSMRSVFHGRLSLLPEMEHSADEVVVAGADCRL